MLTTRQPSLLKKRYHRPRFSLEMIKVQSSNFGHALNAEFLKIVTKINNVQLNTQADIQACEEVKNIESLVFSTLGLRVKVITNSMLAAVLPYYSNKHHVFLNDMFKGNISIKDQNKALEKALGKSGYVDIQNARVGGLFSDYVHKVFMNLRDLVKTYRLNSQEITAVFCHELGHAFYACEYADRMESNNLIISDVCNRIATKKETLKAEYVYQEIQKVDKTVTEKEIDNLVNGNRIIAGYTWYKVVIEANKQACKSQMSQNKYDETAFEQAADNFASRFGYGRDLISGLEKIVAGGGNVEKSKAASNMAMLFEFAFLALMVFTILSTAGAGFIAAPIIYSLFMGTVLYASGENVRDYTYDELKIRYKRIRNEFIAILKEDGFDKAEQQQLIDNINYADSMIESTNVHESIYRKIANFLLPSNRAAKDSIKEQQFLEEMMHNDLFLKSAQLRVQA